MNDELTNKVGANRTKQQLGHEKVYVTSNYAVIWMYCRKKNLFCLCLDDSTFDEYNFLMNETSVGITAIITINLTTIVT